MGEGLVCAAFPHGIPTEIVHSSVIHTAPFPGDRDIRFEPIPGKEEEAEEWLEMLEKL
jgi:hypothetical protein